MAVLWRRVRLATDMNVSPSGARSLWLPLRRFPLGFWLLLSAAVAVRMALIVVSQNVDHGDVIHPADFSDCQNYNDYGVLFANGLTPRDEIPPQRDRLLPLILGVVFHFTGRSVASSQIVNALIATSGMFWLFLLAREVLPVRLSLVVCAVWVFDPSFVGQSCLPLTENIATPLLICAVWLAVRGRRCGDVVSLWASAIVLTGSFFARASMWAVTPAAVVWIAAWPVGWRRRAVLSVGFLAIMVSAWCCSSYVSYRLFGVFTPNTHSYALWGHAAAKIMIQEGLVDSMPEAKRLRERQARAELPAATTFAQYVRFKRDRDRAYVLSHPLLAVRNHFQALVGAAVMPERWSVPALLGVHRAGGIWQRPVGLMQKFLLAIRQWGVLVSVYTGVNGLYTLLLWCGVAMSLPLLWSGEQRYVVWLLMLVTVAVVLSGAINVEAAPRYRLPAVPMMSMLAMMGWVRWRSKGSTRVDDG